MTSCGKLSDINKIFAQVLFVDAQNGEKRLHNDDESRARIYRTITLLTIYCVYKWTTIVEDVIDD